MKNEKKTRLANLSLSASDLRYKDWPASKVKGSMKALKNRAGNRRPITRGKKQAPYFEVLGSVLEGVTIKLSNRVSNSKKAGVASFASALSFLQTADLLRWTKSLTEGIPSAYDRAMDQIDKATRVNGPEHRLFDGGHTIWGSWWAAKEAAEKEGDNLTQQTLGWAEAYMRDFTTTMGMPIVDVEPTRFDSWVELFADKIPGLDRRYLYDLLSFDAMEVSAAGLGVAGVLFALKKGDRQKLAEILGAMGVSSIAAANPILGLATVMVTAYSYRKYKSLDVGAAIKGGSISAISAGMFVVLGLPVLVELGIVMVATTLLRKHIIDDQQLAEWLKAKLVEESVRKTKVLINLPEIPLFSQTRS